MLVTLRGLETCTSVHMVVLEKCLKDSYQLKNSYPNDPMIKIPKLRKTFLQNLIRSNSEDYNMTKKEIKKLRRHQKKRNQGQEH